jgi:hypothetical protein
MICPDLTDSAGTPVRLVDLLLSCDLQSKAEVTFRLENGGLLL